MALAVLRIAGLPPLAVPDVRLSGHLGDNPYAGRWLLRSEHPKSVWGAETTHR